MLPRLRDRLRWWRYTLPFQLAHGPLCRRHRIDVVRVGRAWLCRSCLILYGSAVATLLLVLLAPPTSRTASGLLLGLGLPVLGLSFPPVYHALPRWMRDLLRSGTGALLGFGIGWTFRGGGPLAALVPLGLLLLFALYRPTRLRARARMCDGCPELGRGSVCSGYRRQAVRIRSYEEDASRALAARLEAEGFANRAG